ncbi:MAG: NYN domain-containing protein [Bryobacteraceae bacterium]|nr:NYN domain-containing protein [Bryobacteraceae bacterium]
MQEKLNIAVFVDYDNIEIGVKSTLRREFDVALALDALKERGDIVAKFAYANWSRQELATRQMAENAIQMVQRVPSPRGDKNGADINLALDALEMAFTHDHVNAFAIISGDSDFIPLVNKLKEYGKTVYVVGGKAFTSTILQQNCHEFISYESFLDDRRGSRRFDERPRDSQQPVQAILPGAAGQAGPVAPIGPERRDDRDRGPRQRSAPLDLAQAMPLVERALQVLERRAVQPQLGLLKSTMLQLDSAFSERVYGCGSFSEFVERLKKSDFINVSGTGGRYIIERKSSPAVEMPKPEEAIPLLRDVLELHRLELEEGSPAEMLLEWMRGESPEFDPARYGFQQFAEFLNFAQDKTVVRVEPDADRGLVVFLGAEFYPPAPPPREAEPVDSEYDEKQPIVPGQPSIFEPTPPPAPEPKAMKRPRAPRKRTENMGNTMPPPRSTTKKRTPTPRKKTPPPQD